MTKPSPDNYVTVSNAIDGDLNTYIAAEFIPPEKKHFYLWIHFGKTDFFVYIRCKLLNSQRFRLKIWVNEQLSGAK